MICEDEVTKILKKVFPKLREEDIACLDIADIKQRCRLLIRDAIQRGSSEIHDMRGDPSKPFNALATDVLGNIRLSVTSLVAKELKANVNPKDSPK